MKTILLIIAMLATMYGNPYVRECPVVEDIVEVEDGVHVVTVEMDGDGYAFESDLEYEVGQHLRVLFYDMGTNEATDDIIAYVW